MRPFRPTVMTWICRIVVLALVACGLCSWIGLMQHRRLPVQVGQKPDAQAWLAAQTGPRSASLPAVSQAQPIEP